MRDPAHLAANHRAYVMLDIDGVLHSLYADYDPEWTARLRDGTWSATDFHAAAREAFLTTLQGGIENEWLKEAYQAGFMFSQVPLLEAVLLRHPDVRIVITSDRRRSLPLDRLCSLLPPGIAQRVVGATDDVDEKDATGRPIPGIRGELARRWMRSHVGDDQPWLAIDDGAVLWQGDEDRLIHTRFSQGLQPDEALALDSMLSSLATMRPAELIRA